MRHFLSAVVVAVLLAIVGCAGPEVEPPPPTLPPAPADAPFLRQVRANTEIANPDAEIIVLADRARGAISSNSDLLGTADAMETITGWIGNDAAYFTGSAVRAYCPEFAELVR